MNTAYLNTATSEQTFASSNATPDYPIKKHEEDNYASLLAWPQFVNTNVNPSADNQSVQQAANLTDGRGGGGLDSTEFDMSSIVDQALLSNESQPSSLNNLFTPWSSSNVPVPPTIKEDWTLDLNLFSVQQPQQHQLLDLMPFQQDAASQQSFMLSVTPPNGSPPTKNNFINNNCIANDNHACTSSGQSDFSAYLNTYHKQQLQQKQHKTREITPPSSISTSVSGSNSPTSSVSTPSSMSCYLPPPQQIVYQQNQMHISNPTPTLNTFNAPMSFMTSTTKSPQQQQRGQGHRKSSDGGTRTYRRRSSSHPSVASVVSLSAHEPIVHILDDIEYITFLYSHDRLVKEYTVRTDVHRVQLQDMSTSFRVQNAIYPRANVGREEYDGNRWEYETSCNKLGWELCWLNQEVLCGRRGLIQRAVDAYRNRHAEMRSRRVTRQEKVANGTLRKRKAKTAIL